MNTPVNVQCPVCGEWFIRYVPPHLSHLYAWNRKHCSQDCVDVQATERSLARAARTRHQSD